MPQKKKQFRFKIPWISSGSSRAAPAHKPKSLPPPPSTQAQGTPKDEPKKHPPSRPTHSPASSLTFDESLVPSPSQSPSEPSTPSQDLLPSSSPSHASSPSSLPSASGHNTEVPPHPAAEPSVSEQENEKMKSPLETTNIPADRETPPSEPLEVTPRELELEKQNKIHHPDEAKEKVVMMEKEPTDKHGESIRMTKTELVHKTEPAPSGVVVVKTKDASTRAFRADHEKMEPRESVERKMMFATSSSSAAGKDIKVVASSDPATRNVSSTNISPEISSLNQSNKEIHIPLQKAIKDDISNFVSNLATVTPTQPMDDKNFSVVTLAGENRGATMHVGSNSAKKEGSIRIHRAYKTDPEESTDVNADSSDENSSRSSDEKDEVGKAYVNSNIQSVNNSLMLHGSVSERDPGVHLVLPQQQEEPIKKPSLETPRAEVNFNRAEKTSYQPVIRRRCLRGMFLEPSDDEPDKPRRHGCKFRCGDKGSEIM